MQSENLSDERWELDPEFFEVFPDGQWLILERHDIVIENFLKRLMGPNKMYSLRDIYRLLVDGGLNLELERRGFGKACVFGAAHQVSIKRSVANLWRRGTLRKFAKGVYIRSGRPYGIMWMLS